MTKVEIIGAAVSSLVLVGPAIAAGDGGCWMRRPGHEYDGQMMHRMPVQGFGIANPAYYPWRLGPYGDGNYPGNHDDYMRLPPSAHGG
jgi:hypothetical protein